VTELQQFFAAWVTNFGATARAAGIVAETLRAAFSQIRYLPHVVELDRASR
jgi:membrane-bound lytic murein transglycosylase B